MTSPKSQFDRLDAIVPPVAKGDTEAFGVLSTGEKLYVAMAANNFGLLDEMQYTLAEAISRLGSDWTNELIARWQYRDDPRKLGVVD